MTAHDHALTELDSAFTLPDVVTDVRLRALYEVLVHRMRNEAKHLPMNTVQLLLIERIASTYILIRAKENGELGGFGSASVQKDYNAFWLGMTSEFNRMLGKVEPLQGADRKAFLRDVQQIVSRIVAKIPDQQVRNTVLAEMASEFENAGI